MTLISAVALFALMGALAALPSSSVLLVVSQSAAFGLRNGVASALGVVTGDLIFMTMAILGMTALAEQMGLFFVVIKYLAGAYLIWFGIGLIRSARRRAPPPMPDARVARATGSTLTSFGAGLLLTLGDIKAIVFYASLLPSFLDLSALTGTDVMAVSLITIVAVGGVKIAYALGAGQARRLLRGFPFERGLKLGSGGLMVGAGALIMMRE